MDLLKIGDLGPKKYTPWAMANFSENSILNYDL